MDLLIVEDEKAAYDRMVRLLAEADPTARVVARTTTVADTVAWFAANPAPDLAFFDVRLGDGDSFEVFARTEVPCPVIFTTAFDQHALEAFRVRALDYLLKPVKADDLAEALRRFATTRTVRDHARSVGAEAVAPVKRFLIRYAGHFKVVLPGDIAYIHSLQKNTFLRTREDRDLPMDESLDRLERQLDPDKFFRLNRQLIVHLDSIRELVAYSKSRVKVVLEPPYTEDAIVSSERSAEFKRWLAGE